MLVRLQPAAEPSYLIVISHVLNDIVHSKLHGMENNNLKTGPS